MPTGKRVAVAAVAVLATGSVALGTGALLAPAESETPPGLVLTADGTPGMTVTGAGQFRASGATKVSIGVPVLSDGRASLASGPGGALPRAVRFPGYVASGGYPRAVLRLAPTAGGGLDPGAADFRFGAVVRLDQTSSGRSDDNGDNVFQRGLWNEGAQFKLELDSARPACAVRGSAGRVVVHSSVWIPRGVWYRLTCTRVQGVVTVEAVRYGSTATPVRTSVAAPTGTLTFATGRPVAVGGKLTPAGGIDAAASDQFNGEIAQVFAEVS
ncbi:MAG: hypothetical protein WB441_06600 [Nocardioidaceae bacterium]